MEVDRKILLSVYSFKKATINLLIVACSCFPVARIIFS